MERHAMPAIRSDEHRMPDATKRKWLQIHLSTCVILMFVAAGLMWLNMRQYNVRSAKWPHGWTAYGFPFEAVGDIPRVNRVFEIVSEDRKLFAYGLPWIGKGVQPLPFAVNLVVALICLALVSFACEWSIRRRERKS